MPEPQGSCTFRLVEFVSMAEDPNFFVEEAARCWRLAQGSDDRRLIELGREFTDEALKLGADPAMLPDEWVFRSPRRAQTVSTPHRIREAA